MREVEIEHAVRSKSLFEDRNIWRALQQTAETIARRLAVSGFAGNCAEGCSCTERIDIDGIAYYVYGTLHPRTSGPHVVVVALELVPSQRAHIPADIELTPRQHGVAVLLSDRKSNREIAKILGVTEHTARRHTEAVFRKLGVHRRSEVGRIV